VNEDFIIRLLDAFSAGSAAELELRMDSLSLVLRKAGNDAPGKTVPESAETPRSDSAVHLGLAGGPREKSTADTETITSPIVATFYPAAGPDAPPFVSRGSRVKKGDTLCILEAMKMMNHLEAEFDCEIIEIRAASGDMVEFAQALFDVKRL
jgi:acetyl-CoA carboxylase biotin carboxyl carrier protein